MTNPLPKCDFCDQQATVIHTLVAYGKKQTIHLCAACAKAKGVTEPSEFTSLAELFIKNPFIAIGPAAGLACEKCGLTQADFKKRGRFGCPACYDAFKPLLGSMLQEMHRGTAHVGKVPRTAVDRKSLHDRLTRLETDLCEAIKSEHYEDAARFRDEINQVKQSSLQKQA